MKAKELWKSIRLQEIHFVTGFKRMDRVEPQVVRYIYIDKILIID
jgi:hypothetical protein